MHKTFKIFSTKILATFLKFFSIFATSSCQKAKITPKRGLFYFYLHFCFCFTINGFEGYLREQWAKQSVQPMVAPTDLCYQPPNNQNNDKKQNPRCKFFEKGVGKTFLSRKFSPQKSKYNSIIISKSR